MSCCLCCYSEVYTMCGWHTKWKKPNRKSRPLYVFFFPWSLWINYHRKQTTQSIFKVTSGSACTKEIMRERLKDEWPPNHNGYIAKGGGGGGGGGMAVWHVAVLLQGAACIAPNAKHVHHGTKRELIMDREHTLCHSSEWSPSSSRGDKRRAAGAGDRFQASE